MAGKKETFDDKIMKMSVNGLTAGAVALGWKLGLFNALSEVSSPESPATPDQVAAQAKCKPRYVKEWLAVLSSAGIIEINQEERFWIKPENIDSLCKQNSAVINSVMMASLLGVSDKIADVFRLDGPLGMDYSEYKDIYPIIDEESQACHKKHLISDLLPMIDKDLTAKLTDGSVVCLDVGCGSGFHCTYLAEHFPKTHFTGIDFSLDAIMSASKRSKADGMPFENLKFLRMNAAKMDETWTSKFDVIFIFDACHDQTRPDLCLKEVYRVLKPGGVFAMLETAGFSSIYDNKKLGMLATSLYGVSLFHCLPVASNAPDAVCAGTLWGREMACKMLSESGFKDIRVEPTPQFVINQLYVCKK